MLEKILVVEKYSAVEYRDLHGISRDFEKLSGDDKASRQRSHELQKIFMHDCRILFARYGFDADYIREDEISHRELSQYDLIVPVGGDGTFLKAAYYATTQRMLGFNSDSERSRGGLTRVSSKNLEESIASLKDGEYSMVSWPRLEAYVNGAALEKAAVNEIGISHSRWYRPSHLRIDVEGVTERFPPNSGIIVCTAMGSPAWFRSAGGTPFSNNHGNFGYIAREHPPEGGSSAISSILRMGSAIKIYPLQENYQLAIDIQEPLTGLRMGDEVRIELSKERGLNVIEFKKYDQDEKLC